MTPSCDIIRIQCRLLGYDIVKWLPPFRLVTLLPSSGSHDEDNTRRQLRTRQRAVFTPKLDNTLIYRHDNLQVCIHTACTILCSESRYSEECIPGTLKEIHTTLYCQSYNFMFISVVIFRNLQCICFNKTWTCAVVKTQLVTAPRQQAAVRGRLKDTSIITNT